VKAATRGVELDGAGRLDAVGFGGSAVGVGQHGVGERADGAGPMRQ
jgi:hypothetical protein